MTPAAYPAADVTLADPGTVVVRRDFAARPAKVWRALTEPALVSTWMLGPPGWTMPVCDMDVRPGGDFRWAWREEATCRGFGFHGTYREVEPPRRIVHTETYDPGDMGGEMGTCLVTTTLTSQGAETRMVVRIEYDSAATRDAALATGMTDGIEMSYSGLDRLLSGL